MNHKVLSLLLLLALASCSNVEKQASVYLDAASSAFALGQYDEAKALIDSIKVLFPKAFDARRAGISLMREVELAETRRTLAYLDSLQTATQAKVNAIRGRYAFEKDEEYEAVGHYLHPQHVVEQALHRSFLRFQTDENGRLSMTSIYCGAANIHHTAVRVTAPDGTFAQTPPAPESYETTVLDEKIERADFPQGQDGDVMGFIYLNHDKNLSLRFIGDRNYNTSLTQTDREALVAVRDLSCLLTTLAQVRSQIEEANQKVAFLQRKMKEAAEKEAENSKD